MAELSIVGVAGSVTRPSRTSTLVSAVLASFVEKTRENAQLIELIDAAPQLFGALTRDHLAGSAKEIVRAIERADVIVVGTPVYRASYTGALKHLFDLVHLDALTGKLVILTATGGTPLHGLVTEHQLRPLFGYFHALTLPTTVYATEADFHDYRIINPAIGRRIERVVDEAIDFMDARASLAFGRISRAASLPAAAAAL